MAMSRRQRPNYSETDVYQPSPLKREDRITLFSVFEAISDGGMFEETNSQPDLYSNGIPSHTFWLHVSPGRNQCNTK